MTWIYITLVDWPYGAMLVMVLCQHLDRFLVVKLMTNYLLINTRTEGLIPSVVA